MICQENSAFCIFNSALCTLHSALCTLHSALCTPQNCLIGLIALPFSNSRTSPRAKKPSVSERRTRVPVGRSRLIFLRYISRPEWASFEKNGDNFTSSYLRKIYSTGKTQFSLSSSVIFSSSERVCASARVKPEADARHSVFIAPPQPSFAPISAQSVRI